MKKRLLGLITVLTVLLAFTGCTSLDGIRLSKALVNQLDVKSAEGISEISLNVNLEGMEQDEQAEQVLQMINNSKLTLESKQEVDTNKTYIKGEIESNGISMNGSLYTDGAKTWVKMPTNPKYIEIDPNEFTEDSEESKSYKSALEMQEKIRPLAVKFVRDYFAQYKYTFNNLKNKGTSKISTPEGQKEVTLIEVKIDNTEFPKLIEYTIKNLVESEALKDYIKSVIKLGAEADPSMLDGKTVEELQGEFDEEFNEMKKEVNSNSKEFISNLNNYFEVGKNGITITYGIDNNENIVSSDIVLDFAIKNPNSDGEKVNVVLNCKSKVYNINNTKVEMPQFNSQNTVTLKDYVKNSETLKNTTIGEALGVRPKRVYLTVGDTFASSNGMYTELEAEPYIENESTMVPVRFIGESLGAQVNWDEQERAVIYKENDKTIILHIGSTTAYVNGKQIEMPVAPAIKNGRTMVPLRFVSEELGAQVQWNDFTRSITIEK